MFIGHFAVAFAAKRAEPAASLGAYTVAAQFPDVIWPFLLLAGLERVAIAPGDTTFTPLRFESYPISHSLVADIGWGLLLGGLFWWRRRRLAPAAWIAALVVSHWVLDVVAHRPDLPIAPGWPVRLGLGLWNSIPATLAVESAMFAAGVWVYLKGTRPLDAIGRWAMAGYIALLVVLYLAASFGPPPPSVRALALAGAPGGLLAVWADWADRHRRADLEPRL